MHYQRKNVHLFVSIKKKKAVLPEGEFHCRFQAGRSIRRATPPLSCSDFFFAFFHHKSIHRFAFPPSTLPVFSLFIFLLLLYFIIE